MARCLRAAGVRHLAVAEENAAEAALVESRAVIGVAGLEGRHSHAPWRTNLLLETASPASGHAGLVARLSATPSPCLPSASVAVSEGSPLGQGATHPPKQNPNKMTARPRKIAVSYHWKAQ